MDCGQRSLPGFGTHVRLCSLLRRTAALGGLRRGVGRLFGHWLVLVRLEVVQGRLQAAAGLGRLQRPVDTGGLKSHLEHCV